MLRVDRDRAFVVVEHREVERIRALHVDQLAAGDVTDARTLDLDHVGAEPGQQLRAGWAGLNVREIENSHTVERFTVLAERLGRNVRKICLRHGAPPRRVRYFFLVSLLCGLRLPMRPLSLPAAGSITALMRVGLPDSSAS